MYIEHIKPPSPAGYELVEAGPNTVKSLTVPTDARYALIKVSSAAGYFRDDGTNPTSASGFPLAVATTNNVYDLELTSGKQLADFRIISQADGWTRVDVVYYKLNE